MAADTKPRVNKAKGLLFAVAGMVASALPYLPKVATALQAYGASPRLISMFVAGNIIYQAFKADPQKPAQPSPSALPSADVPPLPADGNEP